MKEERTQFTFHPEYPYVIFCEGRDEKEWLISYIEYLRTQCNLPDQFYVHDLGGNEDMLRVLPAISKLSNYNTAKAILFIRDAETNYQAAINSLSGKLLKSFHFDASIASLYCNNWYVTEDNIKIGFTLFPGIAPGGTILNGTLEDLCCSILKTQSNIISTEEMQNLGIQYLNSLEKLQNQQFKRLHKNRLHTYFSGTDQFVGMKIGEAARAGCFDFSSCKLEYLKNIFTEIFNK